MLLLEQIFPVRVDPFLKATISRFMQIDITLFLEKRQGAFTRVGEFIRINAVYRIVHLKNYDTSPHVAVPLIRIVLV